MIPPQGAQVWSLVGELESHMLPGNQAHKPQPEKSHVLQERPSTVKIKTFPPSRTPPHPTALGWYICILMADSHCWMAETNKTLWSNYPSNNFFFKVISGTPTPPPKKKITEIRNEGIWVKIQLFEKIKIYKFKWKNYNVMNFALSSWLMH